MVRRYRADGGGHVSSTHARRGGVTNPTTLATLEEETVALDRVASRFFHRHEFGLEGIRRVG
jgi:hypothetical protein